MHGKTIIIQVIKHSMIRIVYKIIWQMSVIQLDYEERFLLFGTMRSRDHHIVVVDSLDAVIVGTAHQLVVI